MVIKNINGRTIFLQKFAVWDSEKSIFIKKKEEKELATTLRIRTPLSNVPTLDVLKI